MTSKIFAPALIVAATVTAKSAERFLEEKDHDVCCTIWEEADYEGTKHEYCLPPEDKCKIFNAMPAEAEFRGEDPPKMGSWDCGSRVHYTFCSHDKEDCNSEGYASGAGSLRNPNASREHKGLTFVVLCPYDEKE